jgi:hypothetical protein
MCDVAEAGTCAGIGMTVRTLVRAKKLLAMEAKDESGARAYRRDDALGG